MPKLIHGFPPNETVGNIIPNIVSNMTTVSRIVKTTLHNVTIPSSTLLRNTTRALTDTTRALTDGPTTTSSTPTTTPRGLTNTTQTILTTSVTPQKTSEGLKVFSFDFIDSKEFQDKVADILAGRDPSQTSSDKPTAPPEDSLEEGYNMGLLIPVAVFGLFLLFVGVCLLWQVLHDRLQTKQQKMRDLTKFYRSQSGWESGRASTRSTTPLQLPNLYNPREFVPRLDRISESPEDRIKGSSGLYEDLVSPDSSLASILSRLQQELASVTASNVALGLSPYPPPPPHYFSDMSRSYPNLPVSAQAPFSPYHLAWMTPTPGRPLRSDPFTINNLGSSHIVSAAAGPLQTSLLSDTSVQGGPLPGRNPYKSPYHPNNNTPTNGSENDSGALPANVYVNHVSSLSLPPDLSQESLKASHSVSDSDLIHNNSQMITPGLASRDRCMSVGRAGTPSSSTDRILSGGSNLGSWRYNRLYVQPSMGPSDPQLIYPYPAMDFAVAHNASVSALMGSGNNSTLQPLGEHHNGSCSLPDLPDLVGPTRCPLYQHTDLAAYLHYEMSRFSPAPPYDAPLHVSSSQVYRQGSGNVQSSAANTSNTNTSTCGHMDSLESSVTESTVTGQTSRNTSGYTAGPSHSTSVTGLVVGPMHPGGGGPPSSVNSSLMSHSISSIMPVNSGATHNTPNTSYADTSGAKSIREAEQYLDPNVRGPRRLKEQTSSILSGQTSSILSGHSHSLTLSPPAASSSDAGSTVTSLTFDEKSGDATKTSHTTSHGTSSTDQSQATTAPSVSMQWDSLNLGTTSGGATGLTVSHNVSGSIISSDNYSVSQRTSTEGATNTDTTTSGDRPPSSRTGGFEWDGYLVYHPGGPQTPGGERGHPGHRKLTPTDPGNTGPPPPRPLEPKPPYPLLAATQYWV